MSTRRGDIEAADSEFEPVLVVDIGGQRFGLTSSIVAEVVRAASFPKLPQAPCVVEGVLNLRGTLVPILDIRERFGLAGAALNPRQHLVIARGKDRLIGLRVDRALDIVRIPRRDIEDSEAIVHGAAHVAGIARLADGALVIHDLDAFLSQAEAEALDRALSAPAP